MKRYLTCLLPFVALAILAATPACSSDDDDNDNPGTQGSAGASGKAGSGTGGTGGGAGGAGGGAGGAGGGATPLPPTKPASYDVLALGKGSSLYYFKSNAVDAIKVGVIEGADDADFEAIDVRSSDGLIYGLTSDGKLYKIDVDTSGEELVATASGGDKEVDGFVTGQGGIAFDFNPKSVIAADKGGDGGNALRVITDEANYRLNPANSSIAGTDTALAYKAQDDNEGKAPQIVAAGYLNAYKGTASTVLYDIDTTTDSLVRQGDPDPNLGVLVTLGSLGIDVGEEAGFDIVTSYDNGGVVNEAFLVHDDTFYSVNLSTGEATEVGAIDGAEGLKGLVVMVP